MPHITRNIGVCSEEVGTTEVSYRLVGKQPPRRDLKFKLGAGAPGSNTRCESETLGDTSPATGSRAPDEVAETTPSTFRRRSPTMNDVESWSFAPTPQSDSEAVPPVDPCSAAGPRGAALTPPPQRDLSSRMAPDVSTDGPHERVGRAGEGTEVAVEEEDAGASHSKSPGCASPSGDRARGEPDKSCLAASPLAKVADRTVRGCTEEHAEELTLVTTSAEVCVRQPDVLGELQRRVSHQKPEALCGVVLQGMGILSTLRVHAVSLEKATKTLMDVLDALEGLGGFCPRAGATMPRLLSLPSSLGNQASLMDIERVSKTSASASIPEAVARCAPPGLLMRHPLEAVSLVGSGHIQALKTMVAQVLDDVGNRGVSVETEDGEVEKRQSETQLSRDNFQLVPEGPPQGFSPSRPPPERFPFTSHVVEEDLDCWVQRACAKRQRV
uniref:Uncharacterized protein n=1 Tax=Noctiluca scintillans TaxID=2966 RepID=A0A7S1B257_NOCSC|mmetsp:Transcript_9215/g.25784  ORF Transcript_9215/g.25784 Transcript_9215/m.25784 type:complete len:441 (+) Transcript_9215:54-1376(+)